MVDPLWLSSIVSKAYVAARNNLNWELTVRIFISTLNEQQN